MPNSTYISPANTARMIRRALKAAFPRTKFSVRTSTYSMGASVGVRWQDGPCNAAVEKIANQFQGANFDGMIDLKTYKDHWLLPDGSTVVASDQGTIGNGGSLPAERNWMPHPGAQLVHFGANYVFCTRSYSRALTERVLTRMARKGLPVEDCVDVIDGYDGAHFKITTHDPKLTRGLDLWREVNAALIRTHCGQ
jgi:hypothetical protein